MRIPVAFLALALLAGACDGGGGDDDTPTPAPTAMPQPSALTIWQQMIVALERVQSVHVRRTATAPEISYEATFPRYGRPDDPSITPWTTALLPIFPTSPLATELPSLTNMRVAKEEARNGRSYWVLGFSGFDSGIDSISYYDAKAWIDQASLLIDRLEMTWTRTEGIGGGPPNGEPIIFEYSDYQLGTAATPTAVPTATPFPGPPPTLALEPASGVCNARVNLRGSALPPNADVSLSVDHTYLSEHGGLQYVSLPHSRADEDGDIEVPFQLSDDWCVSAEVAIQPPITVTVVVSAPDDYFFLGLLDYRVQPCTTIDVAPALSEAYCYNLATPAPTATPPD